MIHKPNSAKELSDIIRGATTPFELIGEGTKQTLGRPVSARPLHLSKFNSVAIYEPDELILEAGAATRLSDIEKLLAKQNQMLAFEPPDYSRLLGTKHSGTLGGLLACNHSGPRRLKAGAARDHVLGLSGVSGRGEIFKAGARVVKNVTGYDVPRLMAGSYGTLSAFTSVIFKVQPKPEAEITLQVKCKTPAQAVQLMTLSLQSSCEVSSAAYLPEQGVYLRLEGISPSVAYRREKLLQLLGGTVDTLRQEQSQTVWASLRDVEPFAAFPDHHIWKISVPPSTTPKLISDLEKQFAFEYYLDWAGGLIWLAHAAKLNVANTIRAAIIQGHAMLFRADAKSRSTTEVFQPQPQALHDLSARVKNSFDPKGLFNPGRMYKDI
jgi:glycolate oxidase FAD binding subunit